MPTPKSAVEKTTKRIRLVARIWSGLIIAYALMMIIGSSISLITTGEVDPHAEEDYPFIENLFPLFMLIAILGLGIAWRWEKIGATVALVFCLAIIPLNLLQWPITINAHFIVPLILMLIIAFPALLFLLCWKRSEVRRGARGT